ncbi:MAG: proline--tRNA ligase [Spirochaetia bacterium]
MRYTRLFAKTLRNIPRGTGIPSHRFLAQGGYIKSLGKGLYSYLPLGNRVLKNIIGVIQDELNALGGQEVLVPVINPIEIWKKSGRDRLSEEDLIKFKDREGKEMVISTTHEEAMVELARIGLVSYRDLPVFLYQFQTKYRDEPKVRYGMIRTKEFIMADGYSFHRSYHDLNNFFPKVFGAFSRIFTRCGIPFFTAEAGVGYMGGDKSFEFFMPCAWGEDRVLKCSRCKYTANRDIARGTKGSGAEILRKIGTVETEGCRNTDELSRHLDLPKKNLTKSMVYRGSRGFIMAVVRGDQEVSPEKLSQAVKDEIIGLATNDDLRKLSLEPDYVSPVGLKAPVQVVVDSAVSSSPNLVYGGNRKGVHYINVNFGRDFSAAVVADIARVSGGSRCKVCGSSLDEEKALELGHIFKLGDYYTKRMELSVQNENGKVIIPHMGSYGIGLGRLMAAVVESNHDEKGIIWPEVLAPFRGYLMFIGKSLTGMEMAKELNAVLGDRILWDDREESVGVKFKDADLLGIPYRIVISSRNLDRGIIEVIDRRKGKLRKMSKEALINFMKGAPGEEMPERNIDS